MDQETGKKYILYARKSSEQEERQALSIESQIKELREKFENLQIVEVLQESASAFKPHNRPFFEEMLNRIGAGKADGVIAWHPDRLSRNEVDAANLTYMIRTGELKDLKFGSYLFDNSPEGIWMLQMALSQSQYFSAKLGKDVKRGLRAKAEKGWFPGVAPVGYINNFEKDKGERDISPDPERFPLLRKSFDLVLAGNCTPAQALRILNEDWGFRTIKRKRSGGKALSRSAWYQVLANPFYYGDFVFDGEHYIGKHEPLTTEGEFWRIQDILGKKGKPRPRTHKFAFSGMIRCARCGSLMVFEEKTKHYKLTNRTAKYTYAYCLGRKKGVCDQSGVTLFDLEKQIIGTLISIQIPEAFKIWALKYLKEAHLKDSQDRKQVSLSLQHLYNDTKSKLDKLVDLRISDRISDEEYLGKRETFKRELSQLKEKIDSEDSRGENWIKLTERTFDFATKVRERFEMGSLQDKKEIVSIVSNDIKLDDGTLEISLTEPFLTMSKGFNKQELLEPVKLPTTIEERPDLRPQNLNWLPGMDSNHRPSA